MSHYHARVIKYLGEKINKYVGEHKDEVQFYNIIPTNKCNLSKDELAEVYTFIIKISY